MSKEQKKCPTCPDFDGVKICKKPNMGCLTCMGYDPFDPNMTCYYEKQKAEFEAWINSPEYKAKEAKEKAEEEAWRNRPKVKLRCCVCGTEKELGIEEYQDKRRRRKYEHNQWCETCHKKGDYPFTKHEWILPENIKKF